MKNHNQTSKSSWTLNPVLVLFVVAAIARNLAGAEGIAAVRGWFSTPECRQSVAVDSTESTSNMDIDKAQDLGSTILDLSRSMPRGRGKRLAQELARSLAQKIHFQYVCKDEEGGNYVVRYPEGLGTEFVSDSDSVEFRYSLQNVGHPEISFNVISLPSHKALRYEYSLNNRSDARQSLKRWGFVVSSNDQSIRIESYPKWGNLDPLRSAPIAPQVAFFEDLEGPALMPRTPLGRIATWFGAMDPIEPGATRGPFVAISSFRPGWTTAYVAGGSRTGLPSSLGELPVLVQEEILFLQRWENRQSAVPIIGPVFGPDTDREAIGANWEAGIRTLVAHGWLSGSSSYVAELMQFLGDPSHREMDSIIRSEPNVGLEALLDGIIRLAF